MSDAKAIEKFALELAAEVTEIDGTDLRLDGKTYIVTTEADIAAWLSWHVHCEDPDAPSRNADGKDQSVCLCGEVFIGTTWIEACEAMDVHRDAKRAEYIEAIGGQP